MVDLIFLKVRQIMHSGGAAKVKKSSKKKIQLLANIIDQIKMKRTELKSEIT
jgi:phosphoserine aminotransferase